MKIEAVTAHTLNFVNKIDSTFIVDSKLNVKLSNNTFTYEIEIITQYDKSYVYDDIDYSVYLVNKDKTIFFAFENEGFAGQIILLKYWNQYAYINDIRVSKKFRGKGIGKALMQRAIEWARESDCIGLEVETQDVNVKACLFYKKLGFELGGFDMFRYRSSPKEKDEIALNWYLLF